MSLTGPGSAAAGDCAEGLLQEAWPGLEDGFDRVARVRISLDACDRDVLLAVAEGGSPPIHARALIAWPGRPGSLEEQLPDTAVVSQPDADCQTVREVRFADSPESRERLQHRMSELEGLTMAPVLPSVLWVHSVRYEFTISSEFSESRLRFLAPGYPRHAGDELHPLDTWAQGLLRDLGVICPRAAEVATDLP